MILKKKNKFEKFRNFELLNCEKITPHFIKMAKCARSEFTLSKIKNDDGAPFASKKETDEYIVS